jgi:ADP-ribosylglycohydrolase
VELWGIPAMKDLALHCGMAFPPKEYWHEVDRPWALQYQVDAREKYSRDGIDGVPVDDDVTYTILGLLILEKYGFDFTTEDVGEYWKAHLPYACTAEMVALENLKNGIDANHAAELNNPYCQWIGADIRADGFAFAAAGNPHLAAKLGYYDAYLSHRRNGIYGEMFFAAAESAAFMVTNPLEAITMALREIPKECTLHKDIEWALEVGPTITDYEAAREAVNQRFAGMNDVHTNNNACLVIFALILGHGDFTESISQVVAMGLDNDCTGATTGSIVGAIVGKSGIDDHWTNRFHDSVRTYIKGAAELSISDVISRFIALVNKQERSRT